MMMIIMCYYQEMDVLVKTLLAKRIVNQEVDETVNAVLTNDSIVGLDKVSADLVHEVIHIRAQ